MEVDKSLILKLFEAALAADYTTVRRIGGRFARDLAAGGDNEVATSLQSMLRKRGVPLQVSGYVEAIPRDAGSRLPLVEEAPWPSSPLFLNGDAGQVIEQFVEDASNIELLAENGISARLGILLVGPPGTGKSLLAGHLASRLHRPFYVVRLDSIISSRLGETSKNIRGLFEFIPTKDAVLFLDEMDAIAKLRDDRHELGELKRVVNTVLQGLDSLSDDVIVIGATNHPHLLDPAIWRRFPYKAELLPPDGDVREAMWRHFLFQGRENDGASLLLARLSEGMTGAEIENFAHAARRRAVIGKHAISVPHLLHAITSSTNGVARLPDSRPLQTEEKRSLAHLLLDKLDLPITEIAKVLGVSRQMAHRYLKGGEDG